MKSNLKDKGFTLIELLVVVAIIGILASVVMVSLSSARKKGRDARRMQDIQQVRNAIELYITQNGKAPNASLLSYGHQAMDMDPGSWNALQADLAPHIKQLPKDPCGVVCYDGPAGKWFLYHYEGPTMLSSYNSGITTSSYSIYAESLEAKPSGYGFGPGSF